MEAILTFIVVTTVIMVDPISLLPALGFGLLAAVQRPAEWRWVTIALGALIICAALAALTWHLAELEGRLFRFRWAETGVASFLQIGLICAAIRWWRARPPTSS